MLLMLCLICCMQVPTLLHHLFSTAGTPPPATAKWGTVRWKEQEHMAEAAHVAALVPSNLRRCHLHHRVAAYGRRPAQLQRPQRRR
jgi:hypothetical protein